MPPAQTWSVALAGIGGQLVEVETDIGAGLPGVTIVGLGDTALLQSRDRMRAAFAHCGLEWPRTKVVQSLSPASLPKRGSGFDLALVAGILLATGQVPASTFAGTVLIGELALDGRLRPVPGVLPAVIAARDKGLERAIVPVANLAEAGLVDGVDCRGVGDLDELVTWARGAGDLRVRAETPEPAPDPVEGDLADVSGQDECRFAVELAAAGGHALLLRGAPGTGKTMLARRLPGLLPDLTHEQSLEVTTIHSVVGRLSADSPLVTRPPFESPHHTASAAAIVGGGSGLARPGAVSLAHHGVLFLDECPEFSGRSLEALRTLVEEGAVRLARRDGVVEFPANFQLVLAANDCPCGTARPVDCTCSPVDRRRYAGKLSGPLLDRVDICARTAPVGTSILEKRSGESTAAVAARVDGARRTAAQRWKELTGRSLTNAAVPPSVLHGAARLPAGARRPLDRALVHGAVSGRGVDRCLRLAWSLADLAGAQAPTVEHVSEALVLRSDEESW